MPKLSTAVPKYRKHRASGRAVVTINGRDHYLGPHGTKASRLDYDRLINQWLVTGRDSRYGLPEHETGCTVAELINRFRKHCEKRYRRDDGSQTGSIETIRAVMKRFGARYGDYDVADKRQGHSTLLGGYLLDVLQQTLAGETKWSLLSPHVWKQSHPQAIREYRQDERRQAADRNRIRRAQRRLQKN